MEGEKEAWWLDDRTKRLFEETMRLSGTLTFTVRPGTPLQLTREQARFQKRLLQGIRATLSAISSLHKQLWEVSFTQPAGDDLQALSTVCPRTGRPELECARFRDSSLTSGRHCRLQTCRLRSTRPCGASTSMHTLSTC